MTEDEANLTIAKLVMSYKLKVLGTLEETGVPEEQVGAYAAYLDNAVILSDSQIENLRGSLEGDAVADMIIKIQVLNKRMKPVSAGGWWRVARGSALLLLGVSGWLVGADYSYPFGSFLGVAVGLAVGAVLGTVWLGGKAERRHAVEAMTNPTARRRWKLVGEKVGPGAATVSLEKLKSNI